MLNDNQHFIIHRAEYVLFFVLIEKVKDSELVEKLRELKTFSECDEKVKPYQEFCCEMPYSQEQIQKMSKKSQKVFLRVVESLLQAQIDYDIFNYNLSVDADGEMVSA